MDIGVALPTMIEGRERKHLLDWARGAEADGFSTLAVMDRLVHDNDEPLITLASAAAVTERIRLATAILIAPNRRDTAVLAKQAATLQHLSQGRLTLGVAAGARPDDYAVSGAEFGDRGKRLDRMLEELRSFWTLGRFGPLTEAPEILVGGRAPSALRRAVTYGNGYLGAAGPPQTFAERAAEVTRLWAEAERLDRPRLVGQAYFCLGTGADAHVREHLTDYYSFAGRLAEMMIKTAPASPDAVRGTVAAYAEAGCDELILLPCSADPVQLDLLKEVIG